MSVQIRICIELDKAERFDVMGGKGQAQRLVFISFDGKVRASNDSVAHKYKKDGTVGLSSATWYAGGREEEIPQVFIDRARSMMKAEVSDIMDKLDQDQ